MDFFPELDRVQLFRPDLTYWEPAAMKKRNPPNPTDECASELCDLQLYRSEKGGRGAGGRESPIELREKIFLLQQQTFSRKIGRSKNY